MRNTSRFAKGSGVYTCECCGRQTRSTGRGDNEVAGFCAECYDLNEIENKISDSGETPELIAEAARLRAIITSKGGVL